MATNTGTKTWYIWLISGTLLGIQIMVLFNKGCVEPKTITKRIYKSDTVYQTVEKWKHDTIDKPYEVVLPEKVYIYVDSPTIAEPPPPGWVRGDTALSVHGSGSIVWGFPNPKFYGRYLDAPKLLEGKFTNDSISLTLFDTSGTIIKRIWPISYSIFDYHFRDQKLLAVERKTPKKEPFKLPANITTSANLYGYYSLIHGGFSFASDFWVTRKRWSIGAIGELRTYPTYADLRVGAKYSIK